ncbi:MAG TPA: DUF2911 domain-containing protein [Salinimicrobium sp.]|nr:DUF2911 domain-containing protein [Salinimicrobium sp.]
MNKTLKKVLYISMGAIVIIAIAFFIMKKQTKSYSPEDTVTYKNAGLELEVFYNRPYKKERVIFGGLVPYNVVWRTGANEATTFSTNQDIMVDGSLLKSGKYTLWTIPMEESWKVIFNSKMYSWGVDLNGKPSRNPDFDALTIEVPVNRTYNVIEQFSINFESSNDFILMYMAWDQTSIAVPIKPL